jgi:hypothetical protein
MSLYREEHGFMLTGVDVTASPDVAARWRLEREPFYVERARQVFSPPATFAMARRGASRRAWTRAQSPCSSSTGISRQSNEVRGIARGRA